MKDLENLTLEELAGVLDETTSKLMAEQISTKEANTITKYVGRRIKAVTKEMEHRKKNNLEISTETMPNVINDNE
jgi:two-component sensor histidine kinase